MNQRKWLFAEVLALILFWVSIFGIPFLAVQFRYNLNVGTSGDYVDLTARNDVWNENSGKWIINKSLMTVEYDEKNNPIIFAEKGEKINFILHAADQVHGFAIKESNIDREIIPGKTEIIEFHADKPGEYKIYCSIYCGIGHHSMVMKIIVL